MPIHYYPEYLFYSATCLRELSFDTLQIVNSLNTPVDASGSFYLPDDFKDDIGVYVPSGQALSQLPKQDWITPLRLHDSQTGQFVPYSTQNSAATNPINSIFGIPVGWTWFWNVNTFGEPTGRMFGTTGGSKSGYSLFKNQRRIQLSEDFIGGNVVLLYISDGQSPDNATQIDSYAFATIDAYIIWKTSNNRDNQYSPEGRNFTNQKRLLRSRLNDLTVADLRNIIHNAYQGGIKN
jgi:hypothetical protein